MATFRNIKYKLGKYAAGAGLATLLFAACEKEEVNNDPQPTDTTTTVVPTNKRTVDLVYGDNSATEWENISFDTLNKYSANPNIDTIYLVPEYYHQFTSASAGIWDYLLPKLRERYNVNTNKIRGKGTIELWDRAVNENPNIVPFLQDTLHYDITVRTGTKQR